MKLRKRDVVLFRRGDNEYTGTVRSISRHMRGCIVEIEDGPAYMHGAWSVRFDSVIRIEVPSLTEKERLALGELARERVGATVAELRGIGVEIAGKTLRDLEDRGFVQGSSRGVAVSGALAWRLTEEGRRVSGL